VRGAGQTNDFANEKRKEVNPMKNKYEAPELTLIGQANDVVMGAGGTGLDMPEQTAPDFEFEQD
jgi:hypothetical protein